MDHLLRPLPFSLPGGGCRLLLAPGAVYLLTTAAQGKVSLPTEAPSVGTLSGGIVLAHRIHLIGDPPVAATDVMALHLYP